MRFANPWLLLLLLLLPVVAARLFAFRFFRSATRADPLRPAITFSSLHALQSLPTPLRARLAHLPSILRLAALALIIIAAARPQLGLGRVESSTDAVAIQILVDRSSSMSEPMPYDGRVVTRLDAVKAVLREFVLGNNRDLPGRPNDLIGLITFAAFPETVCPLVTDHDALVTLADELQTARPRSPDDGTAIGDAIALAAARLKRAEEDFANSARSTDNSSLRIKSKAIILLTDGRQTAGEQQPEEAAQLAAQWGIKVYTVGIGSAPAASPFMILSPGIDEPTLKRVASITGAQYGSADNASALRAVYAQINALERTTINTVEFTDYDERFTPFAAAGLAALLLQHLLAATLLRRSP